VASFAGLISYLLAFLSKEYAITLVVLLPLSFFNLFGKHSIKNSFLAALPYMGVAFDIPDHQATGNRFPRNALSDNYIQINPYAYASAVEKIATEIATY